jgi:hypothetical protein
MVRQELPGRISTNSGREDWGLKEMLEHEVPSAEAARKFVYQFHDQQRLEEPQQERIRRKQGELFADLDQL